MMGSHPANDRLDILNLSWPGCFVHHPVLARHKEIAIIGHVETKAIFKRCAVGGAPPATR